MPSFAVLRHTALAQRGAGFALQAPLKLNLALHVLSKRADGYHELETLVAFSAAGDRLHFRPAAQDSFTITGAFAANTGRAEDNLVLRARDNLRALLGAKSVPPVAISLSKTLPAAAGLGGGSADAAACLIGLCALKAIKAEEPLMQRQIMQLAAHLGADVPMCLAWFYRKSAYLACGRGDMLTPLPCFPALPVVIVNNGTALTTASVFARLERANNAPVLQKPDIKPDMNFADYVAFLRLMRNDLYPPALAGIPALADNLALLQASGAAWCSMSGSGASCFGLYATMAAAEAAAAFIRRQQPGFFVLATKTDGAPLPQ